MSHNYTNSSFLNLPYANRLSCLVVPSSALFLSYPSLPDPSAAMPIDSMNERVFGLYFTRGFVQEPVEPRRDAGARSSFVERYRRFLSEEEVISFSKPKVRSSPNVISTVEKEQAASHAATTHNGTGVGVFTKMYTQRYTIPAAGHSKYTACTKPALTTVENNSASPPKNHSHASQLSITEPTNAYQQDKFVVVFENAVPPQVGHKRKSQVFEKGEIYFDL
jgi:hypothetical protein